MVERHTMVHTELVTPHQVIKTFISEHRAVLGITQDKLRKNALLREDLGQNEIGALVVALCTAEPGMAEWLELEGPVALPLITLVLEFIQQESRRAADSYTATLRILEIYKQQFAQQLAEI